jgi:hypothetical protein
MKCIHYHICINSYNLLCSDSKCKLVKFEQKKEDQVRLERVRQAIDDYKNSVGIENFEQLNFKG